MPVSYSIDMGRGLIRTKCMGNLTLDEVLNHFQKLEQDAACPSRLDVLLDLVEVTSVPQSHQMRYVAFEIEKIRKRVGFGLCAVAAPSDVLFGMLRVFEVLAQDYFTAISIFRTLREAEDWLGIPEA